MHGNEVALHKPQNYVAFKAEGPPAHTGAILFPPDGRALAAQLRKLGDTGGDYRELLRIAGQCDGVRCDINARPAGRFERTQGIRATVLAGSHWSYARSPGFCFMLRWLGSGRTMLQQGFDYTYDKGRAIVWRWSRPARAEHLPRIDYQGRMAWFLKPR